MNETSDIQTTRDGDKLRIRAPGNGRALAHIRGLVADLAAQIGFDDDTVYEIQMAVDEACANVVQHAYNPRHHHEWIWQNREPEIRMEIVSDPERLAITINDHGRQFDFSRYQPVNISDRIRAMIPNGYGIAIMHALMNDVQYTSNPETGNTLRLVKLLKKNPS